jgi:hypothetical protein
MEEISKKKKKKKKNTKKLDVCLPFLRTQKRFGYTHGRWRIEKPVSGGSCVCVARFEKRLMALLCAPEYKTIALYMHMCV